MILLVHLLFGAAIGSAVKNVPLAIILAFLGHYFLDLFPHIEYPTKINSKKQRQLVYLKIFLDFLAGLLLIFLFSKNQPIVYICAFFAILPDGLTIINNHFPNKILGFHAGLHLEKIHFLKNKKISTFWRIASQVAFVIISIFLLKI